MKKILLTLGFAGIFAFPSISQSKAEIDPEYSAYNNPPGKNIDETNSASQTVAGQSENYERPKKKSVTKKASKVENDLQYSAYNYKHPNKAAYAKKRNLDRANSASQIEVVQNENYKHPNKKVVTKKVGVITKNDKNKSYPNYKHQGRK